MKKLIINSISVLLLAFIFSCTKENLESVEPDSSTGAYQTIANEELPESIRSYVRTNYPNDFIGESKKTTASNYELSLRTQSIINIEAKKTLQFDGSGTLLSSAFTHETHAYEGLNECFEFVYPITFTLDDTTYEVNSREELNDQLKEWYRDNWISNERPVLSYPLQVVDESGDQITVENRDELNDVFKDCYTGFYSWIYETCYTLNYPVSYRMPDDSVIVGESKRDLNEKFDEWYDENPDVLVKPELIYPVFITKEDGEVVSVEDEEELEEHFDDCKENGTHLEWNWNWNWSAHYEWYWGRCFKLSYPVTYNMPDGTEIEADSKRDAWRKFKNWYNDNPDEDEKPELNYPVTIIDDDDELIEIANEEELRDQYEKCYDLVHQWNWDWSWNWDWGYAGWNWNWGRCYTIEYPITFTMPDDSEIMGDSRSDILRQFKDWYDDHPDEDENPELNYPITLINDDKESIVVENETEHEDIYLDCYDGWADRWQDWGEAWRDWSDDWKDWKDFWKDWWEEWQDSWGDWWDDWWGKQDKANTN